MQFDDDKGADGFQDIPDEELWRRRQARHPNPQPVSQAAIDRILEIAQQHPSWDEDRVRAELRRRRHDVTALSVHQVMEDLRRAGQIQNPLGPGAL